MYGPEAISISDGLVSSEKNRKEGGARFFPIIALCTDTLWVEGRICGTQMVLAVADPKEDKTTAKMVFDPYIQCQLHIGLRN